MADGWLGKSRFSDDIAPQSRECLRLGLKTNSAGKHLQPAVGDHEFYLAEMRCYFPVEKMKTLSRIMDCGLIAVIRAESTEQAVHMVDAIKAGGIDAIEITMTVPRAIKVIEALCEKYNDDILVGADTVVDSETARAVILAGARFVVSPYLNVEMVRLCNRYQIVAMPGAMTVKEVVEAMECGVELVKFFPGSLFGPEAIKAILGPLPQAALCPTGGVSVANAAAWIKAGATCLGTGSELTKGAKTGDYALITRTAEQFVAAVREAKNK
jgi:2-dehydro-3-deoxyphosphogluconate aldolase / (4S)-4-hydroxy-2-oxoglutarate aldolase